MAVAKRSTPRTKSPIRRIEMVAERLQELRNQAKVTALEVSETQDDLVGLFQAQEVKSHEWTDGDGTKIKATLVEGESQATDNVALKELLTEEQWAQVTSRVLDKKKLEAAVAAGDIDLKIVNKVTTFTPRAPFVKIT